MAMSIVFLGGDLCHNEGNTLWLLSLTSNIEKWGLLKYFTPRSAFARIRTNSNLCSNSALSYEWHENWVSPNILLLGVSHSNSNKFRSVLKFERAFGHLLSLSHTYEWHRQIGFGQIRFAQIFYSKECSRSNSNQFHSVLKLERAFWTSALFLTRVTPFYFAKLLCNLILIFLQLPIFPIQNKLKMNPYSRESIFYKRKRQDFFKTFRNRRLLKTMCKSSMDKRLFNRLKWLLKWLFYRSSKHRNPTQPF